ncbi:uncharacterized protein LOC131802432 [Musca domestica]|uniref:Uncharacterized protein LOC131802432 n=1 Tax=Musca domestica TaxID=7370 RepID=A0ABM3UYP0_MUSDO|nr:uncharacterized protein LOC131802432 [Musca domestica]
MTDEQVQGSQRDTTIEELKQQRGSSKGKLECRLGIVESHYKQASYYQSQIERLSPRDNGRAEIEELYVSIKTKILTQIGQGRRPSIADQSFVLPHVPSNRLPSLKLPKFDGKYLEYKNFINMFNNLVHNDPNISTSEKFNHLLSCLSGEALATIKAFQVTDENYSSALKRLKERYDNDTLIFLENVTSMFELPKSNKPVPKQLRNIVDTISALYSSLKSLGSFEQICDAFIIHLAMSKVDSETKQRWDEYIDYSKLPSWTECCSMLDKRCQQLDAQCRRSSKQHNPTITTNYSHSNNQKQHSFVTKNVAQDFVCSHCSKSGHMISTCQRFIVLTPNQRIEQAKQQKLCLNCLSKGHGYIQCPSKYSCRFCKQRHHSLLHKQSEPTCLREEEEPSSSSAATHSTFQNKPSPQVSAVILATALVLVRDSEGKYQLGRALLDSCSQVNFISETLCKSLNLKKCTNSTDVSGVGSSKLRVTHKTQTTIRSRLNNFNMSLEFLVSRNITGYHPDENLSVNDFNLPSNIELADPEFHRRRGIDILLGAESFFSLLSVGQIKLGENLPTLQKTLLGWIVSGKYTSQTAISSQRSTYSIVQHKDIFQEINKNIEMLWKIDVVESKCQNMSREQKVCEDHFVKNVSVQSDGRLMVRLPFKGDPNVLGDSGDIALCRFFSIERKLNKNPELKEDYSQFLKEYEELGHMSQVDDTNISVPNYYIPHHCVLRPSSVSTKLRVVFDASCRTSSQTSLNEIMMVGPTIQNNLLITLLRFRCHRYGMTADIVKMYRQVLVHPEDRQLQLILWRDDSTKPIKTFALNTVTYGTASAPYLAIRSLHYAAERFPNPYEVGKGIIMNDFYVDDMVTGADDLVSLKRIKNEVTEILSYSKFSLSKWHSNYPGYVSSEDEVKEMKLNDDVTSTLDELTHSLHRIVWCIQQHYFSEEFLEISKHGFVSGQLSSLAPFIEDVSGVQLIRVGGRLLNAELTPEMKFPLLLPKPDPFVKIMVIYIHRSNYHAGPRALVSLVQQQFWIVNCRSSARKVVHQCIHCTRYKPKLLTQVMGNLPKDRVTGFRPFDVVGVDFAGPIPTWHTEYLAQSQNRYRWKNPQQNLQVNDMVLIHEDNVPPMKWAIGRVTKLIPGADGFVRVAEVKTSQTTLKRPVAKLAVLPKE